MVDPTTALSCETPASLTRAGKSTRAKLRFSAEPVAVAIRAIKTNLILTNRWAQQGNFNRETLEVMTCKGGGYLVANSLDRRHQTSSIGR